MSTGELSRWSIFLPKLPRVGSATRAVFVALVLAGGITLLGGCQAPPQPAGPTEVTLFVPDYEAFVDASLSLLRRYDFPPDRVARTRGVIISRPTTSKQWFEFWRVDAPGGYQTLEASLNTMRRIVTVKLDPLDAASRPAPETPETTTRPRIAEGITDTAEILPAPISGRYRLRVQVDKSRYSAPERQITTAAGAMSMYSANIPTVEGLRGPRSRKVEWVSFGRDGLLETFLLDQLTAALPEVTVTEPSGGGA